MDLARYVEDIARRVESPAVTRAAAAAMAVVVTRAVSDALGGNLSMSGLKGRPARVEPSSNGPMATVAVSGAAFTLIDKGRRRRVPARARAGGALSTPWGPRNSVKGSTTRGQHVLDRVADRAFDAGADAAATVAFGRR